MREKHVAIFFLFLFSFVFSTTGWADDPMAPTQFTHKVRKEYHQFKPGIQIKISIARVHDNALVDTPFGNKTGGAKIVDTANRTLVVETPERYDTSGDETGYSKKVRELLRYHLSRVPSIQVIEREEINAIVRELDFGSSKYVKKADIDPAIEMPQYIVKTFLSGNDGTCDSEENEDWGLDDDDADEEETKRLLILLRLYEVKTSQVKLLECGAGDTIDEALREAIDKLKAKTDVLLPEVMVTGTSGDTVTLNGGTNKGLRTGLRFFLVNANGATSKEALDLEDLEYTAICQVTETGENQSQAVIKERFPDSKPQVGDFVFYSFSEQEW